jgi:trimethylamine:corrinoid methyltransferase-like protein
MATDIIVEINKYETNHQCTYYCLAKQRECCRQTEARGASARYVSHIYDWRAIEKWTVEGKRRIESRRITRA